MITAGVAAKMLFLAVLTICFSNCVIGQTKRFNEYFNLITQIKRQAQSPTVNSGTVYSAWPKENVIDGNVGGADGCRCCAAFEKSSPNWVELVFTQTYTISKIVVYGRTDKPGEPQFGIQRLESSGVSVNFTKTQENGNRTLIASPDTFLQMQNLTITGGGDLFTICEILVFSPLTGITTVSALLTDNTYSHCTGDKALDGRKTYQGEDICSTCSIVAPGTDQQQWWQLDLGRKHLIRTIIVTGRMDPHSQSNYLSAHISNNTREENHQWQSQSESIHKAANNKGIYVELRPHRLTQYVVIQRDSSSFMTICEVEVFEGGCLDGYFGDSCSLECTNCLKPCNAESGCEQCKSGYYSNTCRKCSEHCTNGDCDPTNGHCLGGCEPGYDFLSDPMCNEKCQPDHFGINCTGICSSNCLTEGCNNVNGTCAQGCKTGYNFVQDSLCKTPCDDGSYGDCLKSCGVCHNSVCNKTDGHCPFGCEAGYWGDLCDKECINGTYGANNCSQTCSPHCVGGNCHHVNGSCTSGCVPGYVFNQSPLCNTTCKDGTYGSDCTEHCGNCLNDETCNKSTGRCPNGCKRGFNGSTCKTPCRNGHFGFNCDSVCHCEGHIYECDTLYGNCSTSCMFGWTGFNCSLDMDILQSVSSEVTTNQSGDYCKSNSSNNAINDLYSPQHAGNDTDLCRRCSVSTKQILNWWEVDLGRKHLIAGIRVYGRVDGNKDQSSNLSVYTSNKTIGVNTSEAKYIQTLHSTSSPNGNIINFSSANILQVLQLSKDDAFMTICKVHMYKAVCSERTYGSGCSNPCNCRYTNTCDAVTGECLKPGCDSGWTGLACNIKCDGSSFGPNCSEICNCAENGDCDHVNGSCPNGCAEGWGGSSCSLAMAKVDSTSNPGPIIGGVVGAVVVVAFVLVVLFIFRRRLRSSENSKYTSSSPATNSNDEKSYSKSQHEDVNSPNDYYSFEKNTYEGIAVHELRDIILFKKQQNNKLFDAEFNSLQHGLVHKHEVGALEENKKKHRYREMFAYDHSRVILKKEYPNDSEYINASFINGYNKDRKFIASQGPTEHMVNDFWRMIWQQNIEKIVMLTNPIETGQIKCIQYWPKDKQTIQYGNIAICVASVRKMTEFDIRTLVVKKVDENTSRQVQQFHFNAWPDKDVPQNSWSLVNFWCTIDTNCSVNDAPIVVHCSAGVGRTGTFIALDILVEQANAEKQVHPLKSVETLRNQRINMVQTKAQYVYLHEALADALLMMIQHVRMDQFPLVVRHMLDKDMTSAKTRVEEQFKLLNESASTDVSSNTDDVPEYGNMETIFSEMYRPKLAKVGSGFTEEFGVLLLPNYAGKNTYVLSKSPSKANMEDFWSLIEEQHVTCVVMVTSPESPSYKDCQYLGCDSSGKIGRYTVNMIQEKKSKAHMEKTFSFRDVNNEDEDYLTTVKQFTFNLWKDDSDIPDNIEAAHTMLNAVTNWQPNLSDTRPILIHCQTGTERSGMVAVLLNEMYRIRNLDQINVAETVKSMKKRAIGIVKSAEQLRFCYETLLQHLKANEIYENVQTT